MQHTCVSCGYTFGSSTFPGGSTNYCSLTCGTRWGTALLPKPQPPARAKPPQGVTNARIKTALCGHEVPMHRGPRRRACASCTPGPAPREARPRPERTCQWCSRTFHPAQKAAKFCSRSCGSRRHAKVCTTPGCHKPHRAKGLCNSCYKQQRYPDTPRYQFPDDPEGRRKRDLIRAKRRRALTRGVEAEDVDRARVGERDGWRCGICRKLIDQTLRSPHPMSQSLDHVIPLAEGGSHTYANTRISHLRCNVLRQHRGGGEQLALIG